MVADNVQVLLGPMPQLLRDILTAMLAAESAITVVGETESGARLLALCAERRPDVVVLQADESLESQLESTVRVDRAVRILAITPSGQEARMHRLHWQVDVLPDISMRDLQQAVLGAPPGGGALSRAKVPLQRFE